MIRPLLIAAAGMVVAISCIAATDSSERSNSVSKPASALAWQPQTSVTQFFADTCAKCHGVNGEGGGAGTQSLLTEEKFDQKYDRPFFDAIKSGVPQNGMEAYGATMSDQQIWAQVVHIRELQAKALRAKNGAPKAVNGVFRGKRQNYRVETVIAEDQGLRTPWAIDWLPDGTMLITNRPGTMVLAKNGKVIGNVDGLPESRELGQGGLMDVAVHPDYASNGWIYIAFTDPGKNGTGLTKIVRGKLQRSDGKATWRSQQTIWEGAPQFYSNAGIHFGSRIVFDGKGHVFFVVGERGGNMLAQQLTNPYGKIYRLNEDGSEPADNPFVGRSDVTKGVWSYGHRNPQGLTLDLEGNLWDTEHGPRGGDEVNEIKKGANYGWPVIAFSINYNDSPFQVPWPKPEQKFAMPAFRWLPSIGACGLDVVKGGAFPEWKGDLVAGGLSGANVDRLRMKGGKLTEREELLYGMGRVREVSVGPDGMIYVALNQPDKVIRITPAP